LENELYFVFFIKKEKSMKSKDKYVLMFMFCHNLNSFMAIKYFPNISTASFTVTYSIIPEGTEKGKEKLVGTLGHIYTKKVSKHY
jgi:hypothetical protein